MALPPDAIALDANMPSDAIALDSNISKPNLKEMYMGQANAAKELLDKAVTGIPQLLTGKSITDRIIPVSQPDIPQSTSKPFDINVIEASKPMNQLNGVITGMNKGIANTAGNFIESALTSPLSLISAGSSIIKATPAQNILSKFNPFGNKIKNDYVDSNIFPKAQKVFNDSIEKFDTPVQNYLMDKGVPKSAVEHIAKVTPTTVRNMAAGADNTDAVVLKIQGDLASKEKNIQQAYTDAMSNVPDNAGISTPKTTDVMKNFLEKYKFIKSDGTPDPRSLFPDRNPVLGKISDLYQTMDADKFSINKYQWNLLRNELSKYRGQDSSLSGDITKMLDALHSDAESAGIQGISNARDLARAHFENQNLFNKFSQTKLDNIFKQKGEDLRNLQDLGKYTGTNYEDMAKNIVANRYLNDIGSLAEKPSLGNQNPPIYSIIRKMTDKPTTFKEGSKLISDFTGNNKDTVDLLKSIKGLNRNEFIRKVVLGGIGVSAGAGIATKILKGIVDPAAQKVSDAIGISEN